MFDDNMVDNIELYHQKVLIWNIINCKLNENAMRAVVCNNDVMVETIVVLALSKHQFSVFVSLLTIDKHITSFCTKNVSKFICFYITFTIFFASIQNGNFNDLFATPNHLQEKIG